VSSAPAAECVVTLGRICVPASKAFLAELKLVTVRILALLLNSCIIGFAFLAACAALPDAGEDDSCEK